MALPERVSVLLHQHENIPTDHECEGSKFHSPRPLRVHAYPLHNRQPIYLCGTCRDNLGVYLFLWEAEKGLDWPTKREFGNQIRSIASRILEVKRTRS